MSAKIPRLRRWKVRFTEIDSDDIHETSFTGHVDKQFVIDWFCLESDSDVTWYEITEERIPKNKKSHEKEK